MVHPFHLPIFSKQIKLKVLGDNACIAANFDSLTRSTNCIRGCTTGLQTRFYLFNYLKRFKIVLI